MANDKISKGTVVKAAPVIFAEVDKTLDRHDNAILITFDHLDDLKAALEKGSIEFTPWN